MDSYKNKITINSFRRGRAMQKQARLNIFGGCLSSARHILLALTCTFIMVGFAAAQSTTDGAIGGTVTDNTGGGVSSPSGVGPNNTAKAQKPPTSDKSSHLPTIHLPSRIAHGTAL